MKPTAVKPAPPVCAPGHWLERAWVAVVRQHRLPTGLSIAWERLWIRLGFRYKTVTAAGLRFRVRRLAADEHFIRDVVVDQEYMPLGYEIQEQDQVLDIGGNIGSFALYAASKARRGRIISLEPIRDSYQLLVQNVRQNQFDNILVKQAALTSRRKSVKIYLSSHGTGGHSMLAALAQQSQDFEQVDGVTLEDVFREYQLLRCDFLKMDCEGAEFQVLRELDPDVARRIRKMVIEYHTLPDGDKQEQAQQLIDRLQQLGFQIDRYTDVLGTYWGTIYARRSETT